MSLATLVQGGSAAKTDRYLGAFLLEIALTAIIIFHFYQTGLS